MEAKAIAKGLRISPFRARLISTLIRGKKVDEALSILNNVNNKADKMTKKVLESAIANAENNFKMNKSNLNISRIEVGKSFVLKRSMPRGRGRMTRIEKRYSTMKLFLSDSLNSVKK